MIIFISLLNFYFLGCEFFICEKKICTLILLFVIIFFDGHVVLSQDDYKNYKNPGDIIISYPSDDFITYGDNISILGCCDYNYDLYINHEKIDLTQHGFFCVYPKLNNGENNFLFTNGENIKNLVVIKDENTRPKMPDQNIIFFDEPKYGIINRDNISHRSRPDEANNDLLEPLVKNTIFKILGETEEYYFIFDKTFVYKDTVDVFDGLLDKNKLKAVNINNNELELKMDLNTLYKIDYNNTNKINLFLYDTDLDFLDLDLKNKELFYSDSKIIESIKIKQNKKNIDLDFIELEINLNKNIKPNGYYVKQENNNFVFGVNTLPETFNKRNNNKNLDGISVLVDAGHGGDDCGTFGPTGVNYISEKDINLSIALELKKYLEDLGASVFMNRDDDYFVTLGDRVKNIKNIKPDLSVSIHGNSRDIKKNFLEASGLIIYYTFDINNAAGLIKNSLESKFNFVRGTRVNNLALTRITNCPAILIETAFLSNPDDYEWLINKSNKEKMAESIALAIKDFFCFVCDKKN